MKYLNDLLHKTIFILCILLASTDLLAGTHQPQKVWTPDGWTTPYATAELACQAFADSQAIMTYDSVIETSINTATCRGRINGGNVQAIRSAQARWGCQSFPLFTQYNYPNSPPASCNNTCTANQEFNFATNSCNDVVPDLCQQAQGGVIKNLNTSTNSATICSSGCELTRINSICVELGDGSISCLSDGRVTGNACTANNNQTWEDQLTPEQECLKQNLTYGTVNGEVKCVPKGTQGSAPVTEVNEKETVKTDSTGTTTTNTTINHNGDNTVTTTTTITYPNGTSETIEETKPKEDFCTQNPNDNACKAQDDEGETFGETNGNNSENNNFYTSKYPNGIDGIWSTAKDNIMQSSLGNSLTALTPDLPNSGSAPTWNFDFNIGNNMNYGTGQLDFNLWDILLIIFRISTLFYARKIIFGG
jgi:hypothetical protein